MKASELMIGDWVYRPSCPDRVTQTLSNAIIGSDSLRGSIPISELHPIPLTSSVFDSNGFKHEYVNSNLAERIGVNERYILTGDEYAVIVMGESCDIRTPNPILPILPCRFVGRVKSVHELQHALRLCGLEEISENFIVEHV